MDAWGWSALEPWLADRVKLPVGPLFCVIDGPTGAGVVSQRGAERASPPRAKGRSPTPVGAAPAPPCARRGAAARGDPAAVDPAPTRTLASLDHRHLPPGDRLRGDHLHRPRAARADDACQRRPRPVSATVRERMMRSRTLWHACLPGKQQPGVSAAGRSTQSSRWNGDCCRVCPVPAAGGAHAGGEIVTALLGEQHSARARWRCRWSPGGAVTVIGRCTACSRTPTRAGSRAPP